MRGIIDFAVIRFLLVQAKFLLILLSARLLSQANTVVFTVMQ